MIKYLVKFRLFAETFFKIIYESCVLFVFLWCCMYFYALIGIESFDGLTTKSTVIVENKSVLF